MSAMDDLTVIGSITIDYGISQDGHPIVGIHDEGGLDVVTQLGMVELARDTILSGTHEEEDE